MNWFILALIAMLCWSGSDLFSKIGSRPDDKFSHWKMVMAVGLVMGLHACYEIFVGDVPITWGAILAYLPASLLYIVSMLMGYIALRYIELSISSPICNCSGAVAALMCALILGDVLSVPGWLAVAAMACGVVLLGIIESREDEQVRLERQKEANVKYTKSVLAILLPVLYCILDAAGTVADSFILETLDEDVANVAYELTFLAMGIAVAIYTFGIKRQRPEFTRETPKLVGAVCETAGQLAYVYAISANAIGAAPIISCYCLVSVLWSRLFLKEKLSKKHYAAIAIAAVGIIAMGIMDP